MTWHPLGGPIPALGVEVLSVSFRGWADDDNRTHTKPDFRYEILVRAIVGEICGDARKEWTWYAKGYQGAFGQEGPSGMLGWFDLETPPVPTESLWRPSAEEYARSDERSRQFTKRFLAAIGSK